jgi:hypothetical protein
MKLFLDLFGNLKPNEVFNVFGESTPTAFEVDLTPQTDWFSGFDSNTAGMSSFSSLD